MRVQIIDAFRRFARQSRRVEVIDIARLRVEQVESFHDNPRVPRNPNSDVAVEDRRLVGSHAAVSHERTRTEVTQAQAAEPPMDRFNSKPAGNDTINCPRHITAFLFAGGKARA